MCLQYCLPPICSTPAGCYKNPNLWEKSGWGETVTAVICNGQLQSPRLWLSMRKSQSFLSFFVTSELGHYKFVLQKSAKNPTFNFCNIYLLKKIKYFAKQMTWHFYSNLSKNFSYMGSYKTHSFLWAIRRISNIKC